MGIAVVASLMVAVPLCIGLSEEGYIPIPEAFGQVADTTISITNSSGTFDVPAFTNSTGTYPMSDFVLPVTEPEPVFEADPPITDETLNPPPDDGVPTFSTGTSSTLPNNSLYIQKYTTPTFPDEFNIVIDSLRLLWD